MQRREKGLTKNNEIINDEDLKVGGEKGIQMKYDRLSNETREGERIIR